MAAGLRAAAQGFCGEVAAVDLLIAHRFWFTREDFREHFIHSAPADSIKPVLAWVRWTAAATAFNSGRLACSSGEAAVLLIAIALATGGRFPASALSSLDRENFAHVLTATVRAGGHKNARVEIR
ncbi:hypothetical protein ACA514_36715 [Actinomadura sp. NTSP31]